MFYLCKCKERRSMSSELILVSHICRQVCLRYKASYCDVVAHVFFRSPSGKQRKKEKHSVGLLVESRCIADSQTRAHGSMDQSWKRAELYSLSDGSHLVLTVVRGLCDASIVSVQVSPNIDRLKESNECVCVSKYEIEREEKIQRDPCRMKRDTHM